MRGRQGRLQDGTTVHGSSRRATPDAARRALVVATGASAALLLSRHTARAQSAGTSAGAPPLAPAATPVTLRLGHQKSSTLITVLKARGGLESALAPLGVKLAWSEFTSGLPLLEALNVGGIDVSADVADTVPVFAQAAGAQLTYYAREAPSPSAQGIVVRADAALRGVAQLKGRKVAVTKAAGSHYLLLVALKQAGLGFADIEPAYLSPADGRAAFERGSVDAWVTWDPFLAAVQQQAGARLLADGTGLAEYQRYYLAATPFARARPDVLAVLFEQLSGAGRWVKAQPQQAAALLAPLWGLDEATVQRANGRRSYDVRAVEADGFTEQQRIADAFFAEGLLPRRVNAAEAALWRPGTVQTTAAR